MQMKRWLQNNFLPMWAKETLLRDKRQLERENDQLQQKVRELEAYIQGVQAGLRVNNRISVVNHGGKQ
jgi:cell division protein FtsB